MEAQSTSTKEIVDVKNDRIFDIIIKENKLMIREYDSDDELIDEYYFDNLSSYSKNNLLPFNIQVNSSEFGYSQNYKNIPFKRNNKLF